VFWGRRSRSKEALKDRLQLVLAYDRAEIPPGKVEALRNELLEVIRRYFPPQDRSEPRLEVEQRGDTVVLTADIPIGGRDTTAGGSRR
jgi:cell division topological specificity factor